MPDMHRSSHLPLMAVQPDERERFLAGVRSRSRSSLR
jgi:hypothetical protein